MKIYWASRHPPLPSQIAALDAAAGEAVEVVRDPRHFDSAMEIARRYRESGAIDLAVVAPLSVLDRLCGEGLRPLWMEMEVVAGPESGGEIQAAGRWYRFVRLRRIARLALEFEDSPVRVGSPR